MIQDKKRSLTSEAFAALRASRLLSLRSLGADTVRSSGSDDSAVAINLARAACMAGMCYINWLPWELCGDAINDHYSSLYDCYMCIGTLCDLASRESDLAPVAASLCGEACRAVTVSSADLNDGILAACSEVCAKCATACDTMAAESRAGMDRDIVRAVNAEFRSEGEGRKIVGYPLLFNTLSSDLGGYVERIAPDAVQFDTDVRADFNHNPDFILGRTSAGTLLVSVDDRGVRMEVEAPNTTWANDLLESIRRGDIDQGSFAFRVMPGGQQVSEENGQTVRTLTKILVRKVSVVSDPAYTKTAIEVRSSNPAQSDSAGLPAPPAPSSGGVVNVDLLRRQLDVRARAL